MAEPIGLEQIMKAAEALQGVAANAAKIVTEGSVKAIEIQKKREEEAAVAVSDRVAVDVQKSAADLKSQQNSRQAATAFAVNQDEANSMVVALGVKYVENTKKAIAIAEDIQRRKSVLPWESPLEWLGNQIVIPYKVQEYNAAATVANAAEATLNAANNAVQKQVVTETVIKESVTTETQKAQQRLILAKATDELAQLQLQGIALNTHNVEAVYRMSSAQMDVYLKINEVFNREEALNIAKANYNLSSERWKQELKDKQEIAAEETSVAETVNSGRAALNLPPLPPKRIMQQLRMGGDISKGLQQNYITGASIQSSGTPMIAADSAKAAEIITMTQAPLSPEQQTLKKFLLDTTNEAVSALATAGIDFKSNPRAASDHVNKTVNETAMAQQKNIKTGDATNIYAAISLKAITGTAGAQETPLYEKVLKPLIDAGYNTVDPQDLVSKTAAAIQQGHITFNQGAGSLAVIFKSAIAVNNETRRYRMFGLPNQERYVIKETLLGGGMFPAGRVITDMSDPGQVSTLLARQLALQGTPINIVNKLAKENATKLVNEKK